MSESPSVVRIFDGSEASFFLCLAIGTLFSVKHQAISTDIGVWGLGRPKLHEALSGLSDIPSSLLRVLEMADEFAALRKLDPKELDNLLDSLIQELTSSLSKVAVPLWHIELDQKNDSGNE